MKSTKFYIFLSVLTVFQISFLGHFENFLAVPNVFIPLLVWLAFNKPVSRGYAAAIFGGFFMDIFSLGSIGTNIISLVVFAAVLNMTVSRIVLRDTAIGFLAGFYLISLAAYELINFAVISTASFIDPSALAAFGHAFGISFLLQMVYGAVLIIPVIYFSRIVFFDGGAVKK